MQQRSEAGFTLIEMMVALLIGVIITLIIGTTYQAVSTGGMRADTTISMQNDARNALNLMEGDLSSAGFMLAGPAGLGRCSSILTYNGNAPTSSKVRQIVPVLDTPQGAGKAIPGTTQSLDYAPVPANPIDAITIGYNNTFGNQAVVGQSAVGLTKVTNGTLNNASLFVSNASGFTSGDLDLLVLPTLNACIRLQITQIGGADNLIHNSGQSPANPPNGLSAFDALLSRPLTANDLLLGLVQKIGDATSLDGQIEVTYSVRNFNSKPTLFRTVVNASGVVMQDNGIASNVAYVRALFAPIKPDGSLDAFVDWPTIVANSQQKQVGAVEFALLMQRNNVGNRHDVPASIPVLDVSYPTNPKFEYQVFSRMVYLRNVAWGF